MAKKLQRPTRYKSATCGLGNAVEQANKFDAEGYDVKWCFAVVDTICGQDGKPPVPVQAVWMLAELRR